MGLRGDLNIILNDIRNFEGVSSGLRHKDIHISYVVYTSHPNSMKDFLMAINVNCNGVINLLGTARRFNPVMKIILSFLIYIYSANKSASEKYILIYGHAYHMHTCVIRLANVFGTRSKIKIPEFGFMNYFIGLALQDMCLTVFGDGMQIRNNSFMEDCIPALNVATQHPTSDGEVFFAVSDHHDTVAEIAQAIVTHIGDAVFSNQKIKKPLILSPIYNLVQGLNETQKYFLPFWNIIGYR